MIYVAVAHVYVGPVQPFPLYVKEQYGTKGTKFLKVQNSLKILINFRYFNFLIDVGLVY